MIGGAAAPSVLPVDLGLPSGTLWADRNIGAMSRSGYGLYFSWGNIDGHRLEDDYSFSESNYASSPGASVSGDLTDANDAAAIYLGGSWRSPSMDEIVELATFTRPDVTTIDGIRGLRLTSTINGMWIFLPFSGIWADQSKSNIGSASWSQCRSYRSRAEMNVIYCNASGVSSGGSYRSRGIAVRACIPGDI